MRFPFILLTFYLICLSVTVQRDKALNQKCKVFLPMVSNDCSQTLKTYMLLFLTHVVVGLWVLICIYGTDMFCWPSYSQDSKSTNQMKHCSEEVNQINQEKYNNELESQVNQEELHRSEQNSQVNQEKPSEEDSQINKKHSSESADTMYATGTHATTEQADSGEIEELNDSYFLILVDCIRVMISQAANEQEARSIIHQVLSEEFPMYFHNDIVIDRLLDLYNVNSPSIIPLKHKESETDASGREREDDEVNHSLLQEDVIVYPEKDNEYTSVITDELLISMISDILLRSKAADCGSPSPPFEDNYTSNTPLQRPLSLVDQVEENTHEVEQGAEESQIGNAYEDESVELTSSAPMDQMYFLPDDADDSFLENTDNESGLLYPSCKENLDGSLSWSSLPEESRVLLENELNHVTNTYITAQTGSHCAFGKPSCVITTSSCRSCKDAEQDQQTIELLTPTHVLPSTTRLSLSGSLQESFSEVLSKLTRVKRSDHKRKTGVARELWSSNAQEDDTSIFNASFSISSLEDMLSPESIPPTPSSPLFGSPEKSPHVLGIRLHKPAGFKDVFLSVVAHDKKTGLPRNISDTWTLGTREEMELILHVDTDPHLRATRKYSGRYCLVFNDKSDLDEYMSNQDSQEDFVFSMLCSHDDNDEEEAFEMTSDEEYLSSCSHVIDWCEEDQDIAREIKPTNVLDEEEEEEDYNEEEDEEEVLIFNHGDNTFHTIGSKERQRQEEQLPQDEKSDQDQKSSTEQLHDFLIKWDKESHRILAFACLAVTSYVAHRCLK